MDLDDEEPPGVDMGAFILENAKAIEGGYSLIISMMFFFPSSIHGVAQRFVAFVFSKVLFYFFIFVCIVKHHFEQLTLYIFFRNTQKIKRCCGAVIATPQCYNTRGTTQMNVLFHSSTMRHYIKYYDNFI